MSESISDTYFHPIYVFGCDPGLDVFGYCIVEWNPKEGTFRYIRAARVETPPETPTIQRTRTILKELKTRAAALRGKVVYFIEKPPEVLYGLDQNRVAGVLKLFSITYAVIGALSERDQVVFTIYPSDWQPAVMRQQKSVIKKWSRQEADSCLRRLHVKREPFKVKEQDIADAVNVCFYGVKKLHTGEIVV